MIMQKVLFLLQYTVVNNFIYNICTPNFQQKYINFYMYNIFY